MEETEEEEEDRNESTGRAGLDDGEDGAYLDWGRAVLAVRDGAVGRAVAPGHVSPSLGLPKRPVRGPAATVSAAGRRTGPVQNLADPDRPTRAPPGPNRCRALLPHRPG